MNSKESSSANEIMSSKRGFEILVVDGDKFALWHTSHVLKQFSYGVTATESHTWALGLLASNSQFYDLILLDEKPQNMDYQTFIVKAKWINQIVPVALLTCKEEAEVINEAKRYGACRVFNKPISEIHVKFLRKYVAEWKVPIQKNLLKSANEKAGNEALHHKTEIQGMSLAGSHNQNSPNDDLIEKTNALSFNKEACSKKDYEQYCRDRSKELYIEVSNQYTEFLENKSNPGLTNVPESLAQSSSFRVFMTPLSPSAATLQMDDFQQMQGNNGTSPLVQISRAGNGKVNDGSNSSLNHKNPNFGFKAPGGPYADDNTITNCVPDIISSSSYSMMPPARGGELTNYIYPSNPSNNDLHVDPFQVTYNKWSNNNNKSTNNINAFSQPEQSFTYWTNMVHPPPSMVSGSTLINNEESYTHGVHGDPLPTFRFDQTDTDNGIEGLLQEFNNAQDLSFLSAIGGNNDLFK